MVVIMKKRSIQNKKTTNTTSENERNDMVDE